MENNIDQIPANKWLSVPIIATITRLLCRELTLQNEYLQLENKILKSKFNNRICLLCDSFANPESSISQSDFFTDESMA